MRIVIRALSALCCAAGIACGFFLPLLGLPGPLLEEGASAPSLYQLFLQQGMLSQSARMVFLLLPTALGVLTLILCLTGLPGVVKLLGGAVCAASMFMLPGMVMDHAISLSGGGAGLDTMLGGFSLELVEALIDHDFSRGLGYHGFLWAFVAVTLLSLAAIFLGEKQGPVIDPAPLALEEIALPRRVAKAKVRRRDPAPRQTAAKTPPPAKPEPEPTPEPEPGIFCHRCGALNEPDSNFCANCGGKLMTRPAPEEQAAVH